MVLECCCLIGINEISSSVLHDLAASDTGNSCKGNGFEAAKLLRYSATPAFRDTAIQLRCSVNLQRLSQGIAVEPLLLWLPLPLPSGRRSSSVVAFLCHSAALVTGDDFRAAVAVAPFAVSLLLLLDRWASSGAFLCHSAALVAGDGCEAAVAVAAFAAISRSIRIISGWLPLSICGAYHRRWLWSRCRCGCLGCCLPVKWRHEHRLSTPLNAQRIGRRRRC